MEINVGRAARPLPLTLILDFDFARVERTLLSAAFDVDLDFDTACTESEVGAPFLASFARSGDFRPRPAPPWKSGASAPRRGSQSSGASVLELAGFAARRLIPRQDGCHFSEDCDA